MPLLWFLSDGEEEAAEDEGGNGCFIFIVRLADRRCFVWLEPSCCAKRLGISVHLGMRFMYLRRYVFVCACLMRKRIPSHCDFALSLVKHRGRSKA